MGPFRLKDGEEGTGWRDTPAEAARAIRREATPFRVAVFTILTLLLLATDVILSVAALMVCQGSTVGAITRRYDTDEKLDAWAAYCRVAEQRRSPQSQD